MVFQREDSVNPAGATWLKLNSEEGGNENRPKVEGSAFPEKHAKWIDTSSATCVLYNRGTVKRWLLYREGSWAEIMKLEARRSAMY